MRQERQQGRQVLKATMSVKFDQTMQAVSGVAVANDTHPQNVAQGGELSRSAEESPNHAAATQSQPSNRVAALPVHGEAASRSWGRTMQPPTADVSSVLEVTNNLLYSETNLDPILPRDPRFAKVLDRCRYSLSAQRMSHVVKRRVDRIKPNFSLRPILSTEDNSMKTDQSPTSRRKDLSLPC